MDTKFKKGEEWEKNGDTDTTNVRWILFLSGFTSLGGYFLDHPRHLTVLLA